ncbi:hypothetical protein [Chitinimonas sp. BJB300]|uniref:hypothetical protein n=1 Tax=Chitinimonas sp. BJB300 TaxID=1559339 RepID=UPI0011124503|nr:hypothetical protein [Chitinimonas sp. BJB300]TSJ88526.1 hypothetical protein FG002_010165 [Chitinimonas sp. BJB300]
MATNSALALKQMMQDLQLKREALSEQLTAFHTLQEEVGVLRQKAPTDPLARMRLDKLGHAMQGELGSLNQRIIDGLEQLQSHFQSLEQSFKQTGEGAATSATAPQLAKPTFGRQFI